MKNTLLRYGLLSISFTIITELANKIINLKNLLHNFLIDFLSVDQINSYFEFQNKWHWLTYLYIPLLILIKTSVISLILYIGLFLLSKEIKYNQLWDTTLKAEFIFLLVPVLKIIWFYLLLQKIKPNCAVLFISHRLNKLKNIVDTIYILENKTISKSGNHDKLMQDINFYSEYWKEK